MKIGFIGKGEWRDTTNFSRLEVGGLLLIGFDGLGEVSYEKELKGESGLFEEIALLSKRLKNVVMCGCVTDAMGLKRKSAIVADNGKILGISDMLNVADGEKNCGSALRVYETQAGKIGVAVSEDIYFPEVVKALALCGCDYIVCPFGKLTSGIQTVLLRAYAFCYGIPTFLCAQGYSMIADGRGEVVFASPQSPVYYDFVNVKEYHLFQTRRRFHLPPL